MIDGEVVKWMKQASGADYCALWPCVMMPSEGAVALDRTRIK